MWKHINSLCKNSTYTEKMKNFIKFTLQKLENENITYEQFIWEYMKYDIRKFSEKFSEDVEDSAPLFWKWK